MSLSEKILARNTAFADATNEILNEYKDKLNQVVAGLASQNLGQREINWKHLNFSERNDQLVTVHGLTTVPLGTKIYDSDIGSMVVITESNASNYLNYIRILVSLTALESDTVENIIKNIKEIQETDQKMTETEFNKMESPKIKH